MSLWGGSLRGCGYVGGHVTLSGWLGLTNGLYDGHGDTITENPARGVRDTR